MTAAKKISDRRAIVEARKAAILAAKKKSRVVSLSEIRREIDQLGPRCDPTKPDKYDASVASKHAELKKVLVRASLQIASDALATINKDMARLHPYADPSTPERYDLDAAREFASLAAQHRALRVEVATLMAGGVPTEPSRGNRWFATDQPESPSNLVTRLSAPIAPKPDDDAEDGDGIEDQEDDAGDGVRKVDDDVETGLRLKTMAKKWDTRRKRMIDNGVVPITWRAFYSLAALRGAFKDQALGAALRAKRPAIEWRTAACDADVFAAGLDFARSLGALCTLSERTRLSKTMAGPTHSADVRGMIHGASGPVLPFDVSVHSQNAHAAAAYIDCQIIVAEAERFTEDVVSANTDDIRNDLREALRHQVAIRRRRRRQHPHELLATDKMEKLRDNSDAALTSISRQWSSSMTAQEIAARVDQREAGRRWMRSVPFWMTNKDRLPSSELKRTRREIAMAVCRVIGEGREPSSNAEEAVAKLANNQQ